MRMPTVALLTLALLVAAPAAEPGGPRAGPAAAERQTGAIRGRVTLTSPPAPAPARPDIAGLGAPPPRGAAERRRSLVYLETAPRPAFGERVETRAVMDQRDETFVPHVLPILVGTTVDFPNNDRTYHNVFSLSRARSFDLGRYAAGRSRSVRFTTPGIVRVFCEIHSHMSAFIVVFAHRYFTMTDEEGRYRLDEVPPGRYTLVVWHDGQTRDSREVVVPDGGVAEANFLVSRR